MTRPYSIREAALLIGMSKFWLRDRIKDTPAVRELAFRTRGNTGHWKLAAVAFDAWAAEWNASGRKVRPERRARGRRGPVVRRVDSGAVSLMQVYRESRG